MAILKTLRMVVGDAHVLTGADAASFAKDWTGQYEGEPLCAVRPANVQEVAGVVRAAAEAGVAVVPVAGNTGLMGGTHAPGRIALSLERMNAVREVRTESRLAIVEAGVVLSQLHDAVDQHGLVFPLTFGAKGSARIGGVLGTNAGGSNVLRYGSTRALCLGLEVVMADGRVLDTMSELVKDNSGYDLRDLFIGAEGTLGIVTAAVLRLFPKPAAYATAMVAVPSVSDALGLLNQLQTATGGAVEAFEYMPRSYFDAWGKREPGKRPPFAQTYDHAVMVEVGATAPRDAEPGPDGAVPVQAYLEEVLGEMIEDGRALDAVVARSEAQRREIWERREIAGELSLGQGPFALTDVSVPLDKVETFLNRAYAALEADDPDVRHLVVSHLGDGNVHLTVWPSDGDAGYERVMEIVEDITQDLRGSFSAEHGIGLGKKGAMGRRKNPVALDVMRAVKAALDPQGIMNPGKVVPEA
ncbi:putative FAD-linked oxidoreductase [Rhodobacteraceae bacterium THAF1]|uniref:FAD-binding oxidoreductase n=1 Tax=Palleronia sp. THAF1 TaxID=2587842 RepID=UPI000F3B9968|nr:FAD-binding oxidoreductase [Palleronia sp. THAF1]QFU07580.1 putative FAD-linked oxidoreductase [Palleronia sp. THAF1]VDC22853.1 putative FAD-linked oxidoreductase [Rhodobacteraceae bacterium THAF1]